MSYTTNHSCISFFAGPTEANKRKRQLLGEPRDTFESKRAAWQMSQGDVARTRNISTMANFDIAGFSSDVIQQKWFMDSKKKLQLKGYINSPYVSTDQLATHASNQSTNIMAGNAGTIRNLISRAGPTLPFPHVSELAGAYGDANSGLYPYNMYLDPKDPLSVNFARSLYDDQSRLQLLVQQGVLKEQLMDDKKAGLIGQQNRELPNEIAIVQRFTEQGVENRTRQELNGLNNANQNSSEQHVNQQLGNLGMTIAMYKKTNGGEALTYGNDNYKKKKLGGEMTSNHFSEYKQQSGSNRFNRNKLQVTPQGNEPIRAGTLTSINTGHVKFSDSIAPNATAGTVNLYTPSKNSSSYTSVSGGRRISIGGEAQVHTPVESEVIRSLDSFHDDFDSFMTDLNKNTPIKSKSTPGPGPNVTIRSKNTFINPHGDY